jgi:membrane-associated phospholipid phosphatase
VRFDQHLGTHFFSEMYGRGIDVFGAYPSLHVAYPLLASYMLVKIPRLRWLAPAGFAFYALMCFSAVYLQHHYIVDILLGTAYAVVAIVVIEGLSRRDKRTQ